MAFAAALRRLPLGRLLAGLVLVAYPLLVWFGLTHWSPRWLALALLGVLLPTVAWRLRAAPRDDLRGLLAVPLVTAGALGMAAALDASGYVLGVPVAINVVLLLGFLVTLRPDARPMIERMARLQEPNLSGAKRSWCRLWTWIWCGFFVVNGLTALVLARRGSVTPWAVYNGFIAYVLIGALFSVEWVMRRRRFGNGRDAAHRDARRGPARTSLPGVGGAAADAGGGSHDRGLPRAGAR